jgi:hypothetical protein
MLIAPAILVQAQDAAQPAASPSTEQQEKEKAALEKKALTLLDQVIADAASMKLPENRVRLQISAADMLWKRSEARARTLFAQAAEGIGELYRSTDNTENNGRRNQGQNRNPAQLRQELVLTIARLDAPLAYQVLASTRPITPAAENNLDPTFNPDENLEQMLLSRVALSDPKLALQNAEQFLEKGEFPRTLSTVLAQLQEKDKEAATKLETKLVQRLQSSNMLANLDAGNLAVGLLTAGPRPATTTTATDAVAAAPKSRGQLLSEASYQDLMGSVIDAALRATPAPAGQRTGNAGRGRARAMVIGAGQPPAVQSALTESEVEQNNSRAMLAQVQALLPKIDQYLPDRAQAVRTKLAEVGTSANRGFDLRQVQTAMQNGDVNSLEALASSAPPAMQNRLYQQAAMKALDEGNVDKARSIADDHLEPTTRAAVAQAIDFRQMADKIETSRIEDVRQTIAGLSNDNQRIDLLIQLATAAQKKNAKLARQLLDDAQRLVSRPATNYQQMDAQLRVARGFATLDSTRSFQVLEPGILQLNELLAAAAVLNGFETNVFREGELPLQANSGLGNMVNRYAQELALLAKTDFERAQTLVNRFQLPEPRIQARLAIVQGVLRPQPVQSMNNFNFFGGGNFQNQQIRRIQ